MEDFLPTEIPILLVILFEHDEASLAGGDLYGLSIVSAKIIQNIECPFTCNCNIVVYLLLIVEVHISV